MTSTLARLLFVGALCGWVAPLGAEPAASADTAWSDAESGCPYERAAAEAEAASSGAIVIQADAPLFDNSGPPAAFLP